MAFFKFRKGGEENPTPPPVTVSVEAMRKRAKHRLIGAALLVLAGVLGFPLVFDNQPRPIAVDIPIEIPDKLKSKPFATGSIAALTPKPAPVIEEGPEPTPAAKPVEKLPVKGDAKVEVKAEPKPEPNPEPKPEVKPEPKVVPKPEPVPAPKPAAAVDDGAKARALLEGRDPAKKAQAVVGRFVVQVGAFSDPDKVREVRLKLERAGLKTYTQVIESKEGKRTRVRVGPFETRADVDKVAEKIRKLDLQVGILEL
jgi:DedD protein